MAAPWETSNVAATPAVSAAAPGPASGPVAPWESPAASAPADHSVLGYIKDYGRGVANAYSDLNPQVANGSAWQAFSGPFKAAASIATSVAAPVMAWANNMPHTDNEGGMLIDQPNPNSAIPYTQRRDQFTYNPGGQAGQELKVLGAATKPISDALHGVAGWFTDDPETKAQIVDGLQTALLAAPLAKGALPTKISAAEAPSIVTHPDVIAANDLAGKYNIKLTKGQQVAQAAGDLTVDDTPTARALNVPYQIEAKTATQPTVAGKVYADHFATQQNMLASHIEDVADALREQGEDAAADKVSATVVEKSKGVTQVNGKALQRIIDKGLIDDPVLGSKLDELNDLSGIIDPPAKGPIAPPSVIDKLKQNLTSKSIGAAAGGTIGFKTGAMVGHPFLGAEAGSALGGYVGNKAGNLFQRAPGDITSLGQSDIAKLAKAAGISADEMAERLQGGTSAPAAATTAAPTPAPTPVPQIAAPTASPAPSPNLNIQRPGYELHQHLMATDPAYRKARLLQAGIIE